MNLKEHLKDALPHERKTFIELCKRVGLKLEDVELKKEGDGWAFPFGEYTWTKEEEKDYGEWLTDYVYKNRRKFKISYETKKRIRDSYVGMFLLNYSWKYKED